MTECIFIICVGIGFYIGMMAVAKIFTPEKRIKAYYAANSPAPAGHEFTEMAPHDEEKPPSEERREDIQRKRSEQEGGYSFVTSRRSAARDTDGTKDNADFQQADDSLDVTDPDMEDKKDSPEETDTDFGGTDHTSVSGQNGDGEDEHVQGPEKTDFFAGPETDSHFYPGKDRENTADNTGSQASQSYNNGAEDLFRQQGEMQRRNTEAMTNGMAWQQQQSFNL